MRYPAITQETINTLAEVFATAILTSWDETGDFVQAALDLAEEFGITDEVSDMMKDLVASRERDGYDEKTNRDRR